MNSFAIFLNSLNELILALIFELKSITSFGFSLFRFKKSFLKGRLIMVDGPIYSSLLTSIFNFFIFSNFRVVSSFENCMLTSERFINVHFFLSKLSRIFSAGHGWFSVACSNASNLLELTILSKISPYIIVSGFLRKFFAMVVSWSKCFVGSVARVMTSEIALNNLTFNS